MSILRIFWYTSSLTIWTLGLFLFEFEFYVSRLTCSWPCTNYKVALDNFFLMRSGFCVRSQCMYLNFIVVALYRVQFPHCRIMEVSEFCNVENVSGVEQAIKSVLSQRRALHFLDRGDEIIVHSQNNGCQIGNKCFITQLLLLQQSTIETVK